MTSADGSTEHDITVTINGTNDAPVIGTVTAYVGREVTEDTSLSITGVGNTDDRDDDAGEADLHGANRQRQAHTARLTSAPMAWIVPNNDPTQSTLGDGDTLLNLHSRRRSRRQHRA
ncbi:VCBS domain-containing protein [Vibrio chagasii]|nr:VCBS domain-containing protein [Vibrio chagasii]